MKASGIEVVEKKRLYVGCGLTMAPPQFVADVERTKQSLRKDWQVLEFLGLVAGDNSAVYQRDIIENVGTCDAFLGIADEPSWGLGWESREAVLLGKPSLAVANAGSRVTRLLFGATEFHANFNFRTYENMATDVPTIAREEFAAVLAA
jgi:hypothetical protein